MALEVDPRDVPRRDIAQDSKLWVVATVEEGRVRATWEAYAPGAGAYAARALELWLPELQLHDLLDEVSFLYVAMSRVPGPGDPPFFGDGSPLTHLGFGVDPAAPEDWETARVEDIISQFIDVLRVQ